jgi:hypothetical protein
MLAEGPGARAGKLKFRRVSTAESSAPVSDGGAFGVRGGPPLGPPDGRGAAPASGRLGARAELALQLWIGALYLGDVRRGRQDRRQMLERSPPTVRFDGRGHSLRTAPDPGDRESPWDRTVVLLAEAPGTRTGSSGRRTVARCPLLRQPTAAPRPRGRRVRQRSPGDPGADGRRGVHETGAFPPDCRWAPGNPEFRYHRSCAAWQNSLAAGPQPSNQVRQPARRPGRGGAAAMGQPAVTRRRAARQSPRARAVRSGRSRSSA